MGASGLAAARLLRSRGVEVLGVDRRESSALDHADLATDPGVELVLGSEPIQLPEGIDGVVMSPGVPLDRPLVQAAQEFG